MTYANCSLMMISWGKCKLINLNCFNIRSEIWRGSLRKDIQAFKDFRCVLYILDFYD